MTGPRRIVNWGAERLFPEHVLVPLHWALVVALILATVPAGAQDNAETVALDTGKITVSVPQNTVLTYTASEQTATGERRHADCRPGGARGGVECGVTKLLSESDRRGETAEPQAGATLKISLEPRIERAGGDFQLRLTVEEYDLSVSGVSSDVETRLRREAAMLVSKLRRSRHTLSRSQVVTLRRDRSIVMPVTRPFEGINLFARPELNARWGWASNVGPPELRFVIKRDNGAYEEPSKVPRSVNFYVEADYRREPSENQKTVAVSWLNCPGSIAVPVYRTRGDPTLYRSKAHALDAVSPPGPDGGVLSGRDVYNWMYGHWDIEYRDLRLGVVKGRAEVKPVDDSGGLKSVEIIAKHPRTGASYLLSAHTLEEIGDTMVFKFKGRSPPSGAAPGGTGSAPSEAETPIAVNLPAGVGKVDAKLENATASALVTDAELRLDLKAELTGGAIPTDATSGEWRYLAPRDQIKHRRAGNYEPLNGDEIGEITGTETWKRIPLTIDSIETLSFRHHRIYNGQPILGTAFIEFRGLNLPVQWRRGVEIRFADSKVIYTGNYSASPHDATRLIAEVAIKNGIEEAPKQVTLNGVQGLWNLGLPRETPNARFARTVREGEIDVIREVFMGEVFYVEAAYRDEPLTSAQTFRVAPDGGRTVDVTLTKLPSARNVLRSEPILLLDTDTPTPSRSDFNTVGGSTRPSNFPQGVEKVLRAEPGAKLVAVGQNGRTERAAEAKAEAKALAPPPRKWTEALKKARACHRRDPDQFFIRNWTVLADSFVEPVRSLGGALGRRPGNLQNPFRNINLRASTEVKPEALAAAIILRDQLKRVLSPYVEKLAANEPSAATLAAVAVSGRPHPLYTPLFYRKVQRGRAVSEGTMPHGVEINLADAFGGMRYFKTTDAYRRFVEDSVKEAWQETVALSKESLARASGTPHCDVEQIIKLVGWGIEPVVQAVLPTLVRPPTANEPRYPMVVPDSVARRWVGSLRILGEAIRAQSAYGKLNNDLVLVTAAAFTAGFSGSLPLSILVGADIGVAGESWYQYAVAAKEADFAHGITPVAGNDRAKIAEAEATVRFYGALISSAAVGVVSSIAIYQKAVAKGIVPTQKAVSHAVGKATRMRGRDPHLKTLNHSEKKVIEFAEGRALEKQRLGQTLDAADREVLALKQRREVEPPESAGGTRPPSYNDVPPVQAMPSPGSQTASNAASGIGISPTQLGLDVLPASRLGPGATDTPWQLIDGPAQLRHRFQSPLGELKVKPHDPENPILGGHLDVHDLVLPNGRESGFVVKFGNELTGNFGRNGQLTPELARDAFVGTQHGAGQLSRAGIPQVEIQTWGTLADGETFFIVQRKIDWYTPPGVTDEFSLSALAKGWRQLDEDIRISTQNAVLNLKNDMQKAGIVAEDLNWDNIVVQFKGRKAYRALLLDQDRIARLNVSTLENAPAFFGRKAMIEAGPAGEGINSMLPGTKLDTAPHFMHKMLEKGHYIKYSREAGFESRFFDIEVVCKHTGFRNLETYLPGGWEPGKACPEILEAAEGIRCPTPRASQPGTQPLSAPDLPGTGTVSPTGQPETLPLPGGRVPTTPMTPMEFPKELPSAPRQGAIPPPAGLTLAARLPLFATNVVDLAIRDRRVAGSSCRLKMFGAVEASRLLLAA